MSSVTVLTVCFNAAATLPQTLQSVLDQTYPVDEYIVIDGNSTDNTLAVLADYAPKFEGRLRWVSEPDNGIYDAMNKGLAMAKGDIIGILNADDWYTPEAVEQVVRTARAHIGQPGVYYGLMRKWQNGQERSVVREHHDFLWKDMIPHPTCFVHRQIYQTYGVFDDAYTLSGDYELMLRLAKNNVPFYPIDHILTNFSIGGASIKHARKMWLENIAIRRRYGTLSKSKYYVYRFLIEARNFVERLILRERIDA